MLDIDTGLAGEDDGDVTPEPVYKMIGAIIRSKRRALGWAQSHLAGRLGMSRATLASIETGRQRLLVHQLYGFAVAFEVTPGELLPSLSAAPLAPVSQDLPLPQDLSAAQIEQLSRLYEQEPTKPARRSKGQDDKRK